MNTDFVMNNNLITKITDYLIVYCGLVDKHGLQININDDMSREEFIKIYNRTMSEIKEIRYK